jgi:ankyrin repeat protein
MFMSIQDGKRPLMIAAMEGHMKIVKYLVEKRAKIDETDKV